MLQEAIADVMGYLMAFNGPWWHALAGELVNVVLRADVERARTLLADHDVHPGHVLSCLLTKLTRDLHHLPTDFTYNTINERQEEQHEHSDTR